MIHRIGTVTSSILNQTQTSIKKKTHVCDALGLLHLGGFLGLAHLGDRIELVNIICRDSQTDTSV